MKVEQETENKDFEANEEKKENAFSKLWKKTKKTVSDSVLESKIENTFKNENREATVYEKGALLSKGIYGHLENDYFVCYDEQEIKEFSVLVMDSDEKAYYITGSEKTTVVVVVDNVSYERPATKLFLDENVEEVNVIKAGKRYFLYKGK